MERPTCRTCPYWYLIDANDLDETTADEFEKRYPDEEMVGNCQRYPPQHSAFYTVATRDDAGFRREQWFPDTRDHEWCGEHPQFPAYIRSLEQESLAVKRDQQAP